MIWVFNEAPQLILKTRTSWIQFPIIQMRIVAKLNFKLLSKPQFPQKWLFPWLATNVRQVHASILCKWNKVRQNLNTEITLKKYCCYEEHPELPSYRTQLSLSLANGMSSMSFYWEVVESMWQDRDGWIKLLPNKKSYSKGSQLVIIK